jgi:hypothetical protein
MASRQTAAPQIQSESVVRTFREYSGLILESLLPIQFVGAPVMAQRSQAGGIVPRGTI